MKLQYLLMGFIVLSGLSVVDAVAAPVLVDTKWLAKRLNDPNIVVVDMNDETQYLRFHLPGAINFPYRTLVKMDKKKKIPVRLDDKELLARLGRFGIKRDQYVVIYDDMGGLNAGRLFWELERIGHPKVSVLNGGLVTWILEGRKVTNEIKKRRPVVYRAKGKGRANEARFNDVTQASKTGTSLLLDVRTDQEYLGNPKKPRTGHIPGAQWWPWDRTVDLGRGFTRRDEQALNKTLKQAGVKDKKTPIITYCRSGHRAAQAYLTLRSLGYENVKLYANSMNEYGSIKTAPLKKGSRP